MDYFVHPFFCRCTFDFVIMNVGSQEHGNGTSRNSDEFGCKKNKKVLIFNGNEKREMKTNSWKDKYSIG